MPSPDFVPSPTADRRAQQAIANAQDPNYLIQQILGQPAPDFQQYAAQQAAQAYGPQYAAVNTAMGQARNQASYSDAQLQSMYNALVNGIAADRSGINSSYKTEQTGINNAYNTGRQAVANDYASANHELADIYQKLGIQAAAADPRTLQQNANNGAFLASLLASNNQAAQNASQQQQKGSLDYNTAMQGSSRAAGVQSRNDLQMALQNRLAALQQQNLQVASQQAQAAMQLAGQYQSTWAGQQQKLADMVFQQQAQNLDEQTKLQVAAMQSAPSQYQRYQMMGPLDKTYSEAARLFGANTDQASKAVNLSLAVNPNNVHNEFEYIQAVIDANSQAPANTRLPEDQLRSVAAFLWQQTNPQTQPAYGVSQYNTLFP